MGSTKLRRGKTVTILPIHHILKRLQEAGYNVLLPPDGAENKWYQITGNSIKAFIIYDNFYRDDWNFPYIYADNRQCFDKEAKCPLRIRLPATEVELDYLIERLQYWGSTEGYNISNSYEINYYDKPEYPRNLRRRRHDVQMV